MAGKKISGNHNPDEVLLGIHAMPETKALAGLVAEKTGRTITDVLLDGLMREALAAGITDDNDKVRSEFRDEIILKAAQVRAAKKARQSKNANERKNSK